MSKSVDRHDPAVDLLAVVQFHREEGHAAAPLDRRKSYREEIGPEKGDRKRLLAQMFRIAGAHRLCSLAGSKSRGAGSKSAMAAKAAEVIASPMNNQAKFRSARKPPAAMPPANPRFRAQRIVAKAVTRRSAGTTSMSRELEAG